MLATRSLLFNALFYLNLVVLMIVGLPTMLFGRKAVFALARLWGAISVWLLEAICGLKLEYRGVDNIPPGAVLIAVKHQSFLETFALLKYAPDFAIILKRQLTYVPLFGLYLIVSQQIAIDRGRGRQALQQIAAAARTVFAAGRQVFIYPEGTRRVPGAPPKYKQGATALYAETGVPCLPVAVNTGLFWRRHGFLRRPGVAVIEYLPVIAPGLDRDAFSERLETTIETACARLNAEALAKDPSLAAVLAEGANSDARSPRADLTMSLVMFYVCSLNDLRVRTMLLSYEIVAPTIERTRGFVRAAGAAMDRRLQAMGEIAPAAPRSLRWPACRSRRDSVRGRAYPGADMSFRSIRASTCPAFCHAVLLAAVRDGPRRLRIVSVRDTGAFPEPVVARAQREFRAYGPGLEFHLHLLPSSSADRAATIADLAIAAR